MKLSECRLLPRFMVAMLLALAAPVLVFPSELLAGSAPSITTQPQNQTNLLGSNATFDVVAGGQTPLFYQWSFSGINLTNSSHIGGATNTALMITNVSPADIGNYQVVVTNSHGSVTSSVAALRVPATIILQPTNEFVLQSSNISFAAAAAGTAPLSYRWYFNGAPLSDGGRVSGSITANLNVSNAQTNDAGPYALVVTNDYGSATSAVATLTVLVPPYILTQPANHVGILYSNGGFTVAAAGTAPLTYQWYFNGNPLTDGGQITGAATASLMISNLQITNSGNYVFTVTNSVGSVTSATAFFGVIVPPTIAQQPVSQSAQWGASAMFNVYVSGNGPLSYQWTFNGTNINGATGSVFLLTNIQPSQAGNYAVTITNPYGVAVSSNAVLTVNQPPPGVPFVAGFTPTIARPGATVTITGTNFSSTLGSNIVFFGAVQATVVSASATNLVVTVPSGATFGPITETVGGLTAYASTPFVPTFISSGVFTNNSLGPQIVLPSGNGPNKVMIADMDGDGKPDLVVSDDYGNAISIYRNIGTNGLLSAASFAPPVTLVTPSGGYSPWGLTVADVDGDGKPDIIVTDYSQPLVSVYRNTCTPGNISASGFVTRVDFATGNTPLGVVARDLDGDGKPDLLVVNSGDGTVSIFRNTSVVGSLNANSFAPRVDLPTGAGAEDVQVADLDGDGLPDIVTANTSANTVSILRNQSTPGSLTASSFAPAVNIPVLSEPVQVAIGDLDGDGKPDITVTFYLPQTTVSVLHNVSTVGSLTANSFETHVDFGLGGRGHTPELADLDGSGKLDVAVVTELSSLLSIFRNVSTPGSFTTSSLGPRMDFATGYNAWGLAIGDLDGDGRPDIVFANSYDNTISIYQNQVPFGGPPTIILQPQGETVFVGSNAVFSVTAGGTQPISYQWYFNGTNLTDNARIVGSATGTLTISGAMLSDAGNYYFVATNSLGVTTSSVAVLNVVIPVAIAAQPANQAVMQSSNVSFTASATGTGPLNFQWYFNGVPLTDGGRVSGSATTNLNIANVLASDAGAYQLVVANNYSAATSAVATLTVLVPAAISGEPASQSIVLSNTATFTALATGTAPLGYQWYFNDAPLVDGGRISGSLSNILTIANVQPGDGGSYQLIVTNNYGSDTSAVAMLTVLIPANITGQPTNQTALQSSNVSFAAIAAGTGPLNFQWYFNGAPMADGGRISGAATSSLNVANVQTSDAGAYQLVVTNSFSSATSAVATLTVLSPPSVVVQPVSQSVQWGAGTMLSVVASGTAPLSYQWTFGGVNLNGATNTVLTLTNIQPSQGGNYAVVITNAYGSVVSSNAALTVNQPPAGVPFIADFSPSMAYTGAVVTITGTNFSSVAGSNTVYFGAVQAAVISASVTNLVVTVPVGATFSPITETVGGLTAYANAPFMPTFFSSGVFSNNSLGPQIIIPTASGPNKVVIADMDGDGKPDLIVSDDYGNLISIYRNIGTNGVLSAASFAPPVTLVTPPGSSSPYGLVVADVDGDGQPDIIVTDDNQPVMSIYRNMCTPGNISSNTFAARVDFVTGTTPQGVEVHDLDGDGKPDLLVANVGDGTVSIFQNIGTSGTLTTNSFAPRLDIPTGAGCDHIAVADLDGDGLPDIVTANDTAGTVSILHNQTTPGSLTTNSFAPAVNLPVLSSPVQVAIGDLDGDGKPDIVVTAYLPTTDVSVLHNVSTVGSLTASSFEPHVDFALGGRGHTPALADLDGSGKLDLAVVTELSSLLSIFRNVSTPGSFTTGSLGPRMDFATEYNAWGMSIGDLNGDGRPDIVFANSYSNTISIYQNVVPFGGAPVITVQPQNQLALAGSNAVFSVTATGTQPLIYQWQSNGTNLPGATGSSLVVSNVQMGQTGPYSVVISNSYGMATSFNANLTVAALAVVGQPQNQSVLVGGTVSFSVNVNGQQPYFYQWLFNGTNLPDATNNPLTLTGVLMNQSGLYSVVVTNSYGMTVSSNATLTVLPLLITSQPTNQVTWPGGSAAFKVNVSGQPPFSFDWQVNGVDVPGTWTNVLTLTNVQQFGTCRVIVSNGYGSVTSSNANLIYSQVAVWGGNTGETNLPPGLANLIAIAGGGYARMDCLALMSNGTAIHWPVTNYAAAPKATNILAIAGGSAQQVPFLILERNGIVAQWLVDDLIQPVTGLTNAVAIAPLIYSPIALRTNGTLETVYYAGTTGSSTITNISNAVAISEGASFGVALKADGTVATWGSNAYGQTNVPPGLSNVIAVAAGYYHVLALKSDGTVRAWGLNSYGQTNVPPGLSNVVAIAAGVYHNLALLANGTVVSWGYNLYGQTNVPPGLTNVIAISAGAYHSMALIGNGPPVSSTLLAGPTVGTNGLSLSVPSQSGRVYGLQYQNSLSDTNWNSLPLVPGNGTTLLLTDPSPTNLQRFYRVQRW